MSVSVRTVRIGLLSSAGLLILTLIVFIGYAHLRASLFGRGFAKRLGVDIKQETDGFTYSQSRQGKTVFTIHAAKAVQRQDGNVTLHDVGIVLYGREGDRADRIYGDDFEYNQSTGEARATGEVHIDLQAPAAAFRGKAEGGLHEWEALPGSPQNRTVHVRTQGLLFQQKIGLASTPGLIEFSSGGLSGRAMGAVYDSQTGKVVLESAVDISGLVKGRSGRLTATHGEFEQEQHRVSLAHASYTTGDQGGAADRVLILTTPDGTPQSIEAAGHVVLTGKREQVLAGRMDAALTDTGKPRTSHLYDHVQFSRLGSEGSSTDARISFDNEGRVSQVLLEGTVAGKEKEAESTRTLTADRTELHLVAAGPGRSVLRQAKAFGSVSLREIQTGEKSAKNELSADTLVAEFAIKDKASRLESLFGNGHTVLHQTSAAGTDESSSGDTLVATFHTPQRNTGNASTLATAKQSGGVKTIRVLGSTGEIQRGSADEQAYDADTQKLVLHGRAHVESLTNAVYADEITSSRVSGNTEAEGNVRVSYTQNPSAAGDQQVRRGPVHVLADRATLRNDDQTALFYGKFNRPARMWNENSQVEAPAFEFIQASRRLVAHGDHAESVHALLSASPAADTGKKPEPVRVASDEMVYSDLLREIELTGHVHVEKPDGTVDANHATVFLADRELAQTSSGAATLMPQGQVRRIVATGEVHVAQPDRRGEGDRLVYTSEDKTFVLTGTKAAPPRLFDQSRGTITGAALRFRNGDASVLVSGGDGISGPKRVRTETHVKQ